MSGWQSRAACGGTDVHLWFGPENESPPARQVREVRAAVICHGCPVRLPCLGDALSQRSQCGFRGGVGEERRAALRNARLKRQRRGTEAA